MSDALQTDLQRFVDQFFSSRGWHGVQVFIRVGAGPNQRLLDLHYGDSFAFTIAVDVGLMTKGPIWVEALHALEARFGRPAERLSEAKERSAPPGTADHWRTTATALASQLRDHEWGGRHCAQCGRLQAEGHNPVCELKLALDRYDDLLLAGL